MMYLKLAILLCTVAIVINGALAVPTRVATCPPASQVDLCIDNCKQDVDCPDNLLCCRSGCGGQFCKNPVYVAVDKPGKCPLPTGLGICAFTCYSDAKCKDNWKCCPTSCGGTTCQPV